MFDRAMISRRFLRLWWTFFWRFAVAYALITAAMGVMVGIAETVFAGERHFIHELFFQYMAVAVVPASLWALWRFVVLIEERTPAGLI